MRDKSVRGASMRGSGQHARGNHAGRKTSSCRPPMSLVPWPTASPFQSGATTPTTSLAMKTAYKSLRVQGHAAAIKAFQGNRTRRSHGRGFHHWPAPARRRPGRRRSNGLVSEGNNEDAEIESLNRQLRRFYDKYGAKLNKFIPCIIHYTGRRCRWCSHRCAVGGSVYERAATTCVLGMARLTCRRQFPVRLAWACTIHKAQGYAREVRLVLASLAPGGEGAAVVGQVYRAL